MNLFIFSTPYFNWASAIKLSRSHMIDLNSWMIILHKLLVCVIIWLDQKRSHKNKITKGETKREKQFILNHDPYSANDCRDYHHDWKKFPPSKQKSIQKQQKLPPSNELVVQNRVINVYHAQIHLCQFCEQWYDLADLIQSKLKQTD